MGLSDSEVERHIFFSAELPVPTSPSQRRQNQKILKEPHPQFQRHRCQQFGMLASKWVSNWPKYLWEKPDLPVKISCQQQGKRNCLIAGNFKLYDHTREELSLDEMEKIKI